jgi:hypothetical protein
MYVIAAITARIRMKVAFFCCVLYTCAAVGGATALHTSCHKRSDIAVTESGYKVRRVTDSSLEHNLACSNCILYCDKV